MGTRITKFSGEYENTIGLKTEESDRLLRWRFGNVVVGIINFGVSSFIGHDQGLNLVHSVQYGVFNSTVVGIAGEIIARMYSKSIDDNSFREKSTDNATAPILFIRLLSGVEDSHLMPMDPKVSSGSRQLQVPGFDQAKRPTYTDPGLDHDQNGLPLPEKE